MPPQGRPGAQGRSYIRTAGFEPEAKEKHKGRPQPWLIKQRYKGKGGKTDDVWSNCPGYLKSFAAHPGADHLRAFRDWVEWDLPLKAGGGNQKKRVRDEGMSSASLQPNPAKRSARLGSVSLRVQFFFTVGADVTSVSPRK